MPREEAYPKARDAVKKALEIDNSLISFKAFQTLFIDWDFPAAEHEFKQAIELKSAYGGSHFGYQKLLRMTGRYHEALNEIKLAQELDPMRSYVFFDAITIYSILGRYDEAMEQFNKVTEIYPDHPVSYYLLAKLYIQQGRYKEAIDALDKSSELGYSSRELGYSTNTQKGIVYALSGSRDKSEQVIKELIKHWNERKAESANIAKIFAALIEKDKAFEWLDKSYEEHDREILYLKCDYEWDPIRSDPRFKALLKKMGLPED